MSGKFQRSKLEGKTKTERDKNVDYIVRDITGLYEDFSAFVSFTEAPIDGQEYVRKDGGWTVASGGGSDYTYSELTLSDTQMKTGLDVGFDIVAAQGAGTYLEYFGVIEFNHNTTAYSMSDGLVVGNQNSYGGNYIADDLISSSEDRVIWFSSNGVGQEDSFTPGVSTGYSVPLNEALRIFTYNGTNPTLGDGDILIKVWYKVKTKGTEL